MQCTLSDTCMWRDLSTGMTRHGPRLSRPFGERQTSFWYGPRPLSPPTSQIAPMAPRRCKGVVITRPCMASVLWRVTKEIYRMVRSCANDFTARRGAHRAVVRHEAAAVAGRPGRLRDLGFASHRRCRNRGIGSLYEIWCEVDERQYVRRDTMRLGRPYAPPSSTALARDLEHPPRAVRGRPDLRGRLAVRVGELVAEHGVRFNPTILQVSRCSQVQSARCRDYSTNGCSWRPDLA